MSEISPGWYKDPVDRTTQRYWDGEGWIGDPLPADAEPPVGPPTTGTPTPAPRPPAVPATRTRPPTTSPPTTPPGTAAPPGSPSDSNGSGPPPGGGYRSGALTPKPPPTVPGLSTGPAEPPRPHGYALATSWSRIMARLIDILAVLLLNVVVNGWFVVQYVQEMWPYAQAISRQMASGEPLNDVVAPESVSTLQLTILFLAAAAWFAYEVPATANSGQTLGKRLMHIKVIRVENTDPIGFGRAWRRWNPLGLPTLLWNCCGIGLLLQAADLISGLVDRPLRQAAHDRWAGTVVVQSPPDAGPVSLTKGGTN